MAEEEKQSKRKGRQPEQVGRSGGYIPWVPRKGKWRTDLDVDEIRTERLRRRYFERGGFGQTKLLGETKTQAQISAEHHATAVANREDIDFCVV